MINEGLREGGVLSPILFIMNVDDVVIESEKKTSKMQIMFNKLKSVGVLKCWRSNDLCRNRK